MAEIIIKANKRDIVGKKVRALRRAGLLPAVIYGHHIEPLPIAMDYRETSRIIEKIASSALVVLEVNGEKYYSLVREKQRNPLTGKIQHVDFQAVSLTEKVRTEVPLRLVGESPAVENYLGILLPSMETIEIECLPGSLPEYIEVDLSKLKEIGDSILVGDLVLPEGVEVLTGLDDVVVVVAAPQAEEIPVEELEGAEEEPEVVERGKRREEEEE